MDVIKPYEVKGFRIRDVTKPCEFLGLGPWALEALLGPSWGAPGGRTKKHKNSHRVNYPPGLNMPPHGVRLVIAGPPTFDGRRKQP